MKKKSLLMLFHFLMVLLLIGGPYLHAQGVQYDSLVKPMGYVAAHAQAHIDAQAEVLILKDLDPWRFPANELILNEMKIPYSVAGTNEMLQLNLNNYKLIIIASDQPQAFYNNFNNRLDDFEAFVQNGGILQFNAADKGWEMGFWAELPGGVTHKKRYDENNYVVNEDHPFVDNIPSTIEGLYASHGHFLNIPGMTTMITRDTEGLQTTIEYRLGTGRVISSTVCMEAAYGWKWDSARMLENIIRYALDLQGIVPCQSPMIRVYPEEMPKVTLETNENATQTLTISNDGCEDLNFEIEIQDKDKMDAAFMINASGSLPNGVEGSEVKPDNYVADVVVENVEAAHDVLIFKDVDPWKTKSNEVVLQEMGVDYSVANSSSMAAMNLSDYKLIIVASDQPQSFYDRYQANFPKFDAFVRNGGTLVFNAADKGWQSGAWIKLPGNVTRELYYDRSNDVINPDHPFVSGLPASFSGNYASHDHFIDVPANTTMITRDDKRYQTTIEYNLGNGRVIASGVTLEASYDWGWAGGKILVNILRNALSDIPPPLMWLSADIESGVVMENQSKQLTLTYDATGLSEGIYNARIVIKSNDPLKKEIIVNATLEVSGGGCPIADPDEVTTCVDKAQDIILTATDPNNDSLTYSIVDSPSHGKITGTPPNITYTPTEHYAGSDSFTFKASDGNCDSNIAEVKIEIERSILKVEPGAIEKNLNLGQTINQTITLTNEGCETLLYETALTEVKSPGGVNNLAGVLSEPVIINDIPADAEVQPHELIVRFVPNADQGQIAGIMNDLGAAVKEEIPELNMKVLKFPEYGMNSNEMMVDTIHLLAADPNVLYAEPNYIVKAIGLPNDPQFENLWGLHNDGQVGCAYDPKEPGQGGADISVLGAWDKYTTGSSDIVVAVIDTGIDYSHQDLDKNMWMNDDETPGNNKDDDNNGYVDDIYGYDFHNNDGNPNDDNGHGTHCAGTIGAIGDNGIGVVGVNHTVRLMALKFLNEYGFGDTANAVKAIMYAVENGARILSNSWGGAQFSNAMKEAIAYANDKDVLFVAAAGNSYRDNDLDPHYPSNYDIPNVVAVTAIDCLNKKPNWSHWGANTVDLAAPGINILSTYPNNAYKLSSGTSMATPHVAGAAALLLAFKTDLKALDVKDLILNTVDSVDDLIGKTVTGGRLNVEAALNELAQSEWITLSGNLTGSIQPGGSVTLTVNLDATGDKYGGVYTADIKTLIVNNPANPVQVIAPVKLNINAGDYVLRLNPDGNGKVKIDGAVYDLPFEKSYPEVGQVEIEAIPTDPSKFKEWSGVDDKDKFKNPLNLVMDQNHTITARFTNAEMVGLEVKGVGRVKLDDIERDLPFVKEIVKGESVTLEALGNFIKWTIDLETTDNPITLTMDSDKTLMPVFKNEEKWQAKIIAEGENINGNGLAYEDWAIKQEDNALVNKYQVIFGVDSTASTTPAPPAPPEYSVKLDLSEPPNFVNRYYKHIHQSNAEKNYTWYLMVDPNGNMYNEMTSTIRWNPEELCPTGQYSIRDYDTDEIVVDDMRETTEFTVTGKETKIFLIEKKEGEFLQNLKKGWELISLPVEFDGMTVDTVYPEAEAVYKFDGQYQLLEGSDLLEAGLGYWIKHAAAGKVQMQCLAGEVVLYYEKVLSPGWHLIGAPYGKARVEPYDKIEVIYGFDESYYPDQRVNAGNGYWIKITGNEDVKICVYIVK